MIGGGWETGLARPRRRSSVAADLVAAVAILAFVAVAMLFGGFAQ
jgi:hypothetical protein